MRTFDRAMYAMFLLVLLADVARAQSLTPVGIDASGGLMLSAAMPAGANSAVEAVRVSRANSEGQVRSTPQPRGFNRELLAGYRAASATVRRTASGPVRSIFDGTSLVAVVQLMAMPLPDSGQVYAAPMTTEAPALPMVTHTGSPAP